MGTQRKEAVSAWVDGEGSELDLKQWLQDEPSHKEWERYHLIGDAMRGELPDTLQLDIASSVAAAIDDEPTVLAPKPKASVTERFSGRVVSFSRQFGQYAIAATVAAVAVVGVQQYGNQNQATSPVLNTMPILGAPTPASYQANTPSFQQAQDSELQAQEQRRRVNAYLRDHLLQQRLTGHNADNNN